jgi:hypothetical protein
MGDATAAQCLFLSWLKRCITYSIFSITKNWIMKKGKEDVLNFYANSLIILAFFIASLSICSIESTAQFIVKVRPTVVVRVRPLAPSRGHIWIEPEYVWRNGNYVMVDGYWAAPRPRYNYMPGRWKMRRGGFIGYLGIGEGFKCNNIK